MGLVDWTRLHHRRVCGIHGCTSCHDRDSSSMQMMWFMDQTRVHGTTQISCTDGTQQQDGCHDDVPDVVAYRDVIDGLVDDGNDLEHEEDDDVDEKDAEITRVEFPCTENT